MDFGFSLPWGSDKAIFKVRGWREMIRRIGEIYAANGTARAAAQVINGMEHLNGHGPYRFNADLRGPKPTYNLGAQHTFSSRDAPDPCR